MGIFGELLGNASKVDIEKVKQEYAKILAAGEHIDKAYRVIRDLLIFTDKRLILINVQGITGKKVEYHSIPYRSIRQFVVASTGHFELEAELKIYVADMGTKPLALTFGKDDDVYEVQSMLADYISRA